MQVYQLAKELKVGSSAIIQEAAKLGIVLDSHMSGLNDDQEALIRLAFDEDKLDPAEADSPISETMRGVPSDIPTASTEIPSTNPANDITNPVLAESVSNMITNQLSEVAREVNKLLIQYHKEELTDGYSYIRTGLGILEGQAIPLIKSGLKALGVS